ncbi:MCE family protein [Mycobacterium sp. CBMA271]|uniref:MCE family protein n=1 Tax=unclassified Mycobacteroides TaxID=2618759 RepID=UPI0012DEDE7E|nr:MULTISPECIES: MCE family protein [unclassified Mycobacteroides]MUM19746.1 mammalian cell entry protein [Mycobacteroides sp. CBMA 326]MUM21098.1 MCE family protein [Mycobacteroides sp. CBMA 271]
MNGIQRRIFWAGSAMVAIVAMAVSGWWYTQVRSDSITVTAQFPSVSGLYPDNDVSVLGMPVGKVTKITPQGAYMEVEFTINRSVKVPELARAVLVSTSILTDRHIELTPVYRDGAEMKDRDVIGLSRTRVPVEFSKVLSMIDRLSSSLKGDGVGGGPLADIVSSGEGAVSGNGETIKGALDQLSKALRLSADGGVASRDQLTSVIKNISSLFDRAAANDGRIRKFGSAVHQMSQILDDEALGSGTTGKQLNEILVQASSLLNANRDVLHGSVGNADTIVKTLYDKRRELSETFDVAPLTVDNFYNTFDPVNRVIRVHPLIDKIIVEGQHAKEICNLMGLRQLGCSTGTLQDYGPDFGLTAVLDGLAAMGQK